MMLGLAIGLTVLLAVVGLGVHASRRPEATVGPFRVVEVARVATGHQRAERLAFLDHGRLLAATCPRYGRLMLYRVTDVPGFELVRDIPVGGRPVALAAGEERIYVLSRPNNDARHVEPGWWEAFDFEGRSVSDRVPVGLYPDDLALTKDGRHLLILTSGRGEGGEHRPAPMLAIHQFAGSAHPLLLSQLTFEAKGDDPARLAISSDGSTAAVSLQGSNAVAWVDLSDLAHPQFKDRRAWPEGSPPESLAFDQAGRLVAADPVGEGLVVQRDARSEPAQIPVGAEVGDIVEIPGEPSLWAFTEPMESVVAFLPGNLDHSESPETLALRGRANLASTRPLGLAYCPERGLLAVSNRSGGSLHLVTLRK
jgi:glycerol-3-phosphate acyltransferase PlsY